MTCATEENHQSNNQKTKPKEKKMLKFMTAAAALALFASPAHADCKYNWFLYDLESFVDREGVCRVNLEGDWMTEDMLVIFMEMALEEEAEEAANYELNIERQVELDQRPFFPPKLLLTEKQFLGEVERLVSMYGRDEWVYHWQYSKFGWPIQYFKSDGTHVNFDHKAEFGYPE